jgi:hypothetical protein
MGNCLTCLIHVSIGRHRVGVICFIIVDVSICAVTAALFLSARSGLVVAILVASCELRLELATIGVRKAVRPSMVRLWMKGTLVLVAVAFIAALSVVSITSAASIAAIVSTVAGVVTGTIAVVVASGRASEIGQNSFCRCRYHPRGHSSPKGRPKRTA